jgi:putative FmdB family regulatory protein
MPTYEYACSGCGHEWEQEQRIVEPPVDTCPACQQKTARRQISAGNFILKGGGWYADLYSKPSKKAEKSEGSSSSSGSSASSGSSSSPTKSESKPESKSEAKPEAKPTTTS